MHLLFKQQAKTVIAKDVHSTGPSAICMSGICGVGIPWSRVQSHWLMGLWVEGTMLSKANIYSTGFYIVFHYREKLINEAT